MRRSLSPLRVTSSASAELGVDVGGRPKLRSAFLPHITQEPEVPDFDVGHFVDSTDAQLERAHASPLGDQGPDRRRPTTFF